MTQPIKSNFRMMRGLIMVLPQTAVRQEGELVVVGVDPTVPIEGIVLVVGEGARGKRNTIEPMPVKQGDRIVFVKSAAREIKYKGDTLLVIKPADVLCKLEKD